MTDPQAPIAWRGAARMGLGWGLFIGAAGDNRPHSHHALQVLLSDTPKALWTERSGWCSYLGVMIGPELTHALAPGAEDVTLIYVEPESDAGRRLQSTLHAGIRVLSADEVAAIRRDLDRMPEQEPDWLLTTLLTAETQTKAVAAADEVIDRIVSALPMQLTHPVSAAMMARKAGLSSSRFQHRFRACTGLALRPYLRWRRLLVAMAAVMQGETLTGAAVSAGFADAAHFTRTVRRHFGITPSTVSQLGSLHRAQSIRSRRSES